jgi:nucleoside-diphosphate-sugar epimerase
MKRVLLTGANGFVGSNVYMRLKSRFNIIPAHSIDLRSELVCRKTIENSHCDVIVHTAGKVGGIGANGRNPGRFFYDNMLMGLNMIEHARQVGVDKFIMLGTVCSYPKLTPVPFSESEIWNGYPEETNAPYGIAKKALMEMISAYHKQYNFPGVNLIPVNMYGPHDHFNLTDSHVIPALITKIDQAKKNGDESIKVWGTGEASREFLFVGDFAEAVGQAIDVEVGPEPINIGTGKEIKISELVEKICSILGYDGEILYDTSKPDGQPRRCLDVTRAKDLLGFEALTNLDQGLEQTIEFYNLKKGEEE